MSGYELNFWFLPFFSQPRKETIIKVNGQIEIQFGFTNSDNSIGFGLIYGNNTGYKNLKELSATTWCNVNLRVLYGNYTLLNVWQGNNWYELDPTMKVLHLVANTTNIEENNEMLIKKTTVNLGGWVGDFRVLKIN